MRKKCVGIDPSHKARLFEPYEQDRSHGRNTGGTGLGLAIARRFVELLGGEIGVESTLGRGTTFWFTAKFGLGATPLPGATLAHIWKSSNGPGTRRGHILVVEDIVPNQQIVLAQLARLGYTADIACNGREAIVAAATGRHDAIRARGWRRRRIAASVLPRA